jgi:hypothetical protein
VPVKKVRLAVGVLGLTPALGMIMPAANAATTSARPALAQGATRTMPLWTNCTPAGHSTTATASNSYVTWTGSGVPYYGQIKYANGGCVTKQYFHITSRRTGLTERVRFRSINNGIIRSTFQAGRIQSMGGYSTFFTSYPRVAAHLVCEALVANNNHNDVETAAVCQTT